METAPEIALRRYGGDFPNHYHHFSEGLFLDASAYLRPGDTAIDAGCYLGDNALRMAEHVGESGRVLTFEPDPRLREKAGARIGGTGIAARIDLLNIALSDRGGVATFHVVNEIEGHSGLAIRNNHGRAVTRSPISVDLWRLDDLLPHRTLSRTGVRLIKYDVEGAELNAFRGSVQTLAEARPLVMFEYGNLEAFGHTPADFVEFFSGLDYRIVDCFGEQLTTAETLAATKGWNLFAAPDDDAEAFLDGLIEPALKRFLD